MLPFEARLLIEPGMVVLAYQLVLISRAPSCIVMQATVASGTAQHSILAHEITSDASLCLGCGLMLALSVVRGDSLVP